MAPSSKASSLTEERRPLLEKRWSKAFSSTTSHFHSEKTKEEIKLSDKAKSQKAPLRKRLQFHKLVEWQRDSKIAAFPSSQYRYASPKDRLVIVMATVLSLFNGSIAPIRAIWMGWVINALTDAQFAITNATMSVQFYGANDSFLSSRVSQR